MWQCKVAMQSGTKLLLGCCCYIRLAKGQAVGTATYNAKVATPKKYQATVDLRQRHPFVKWNKKFIPFFNNKDNQVCR